MQDVRSENDMHDVRSENDILDVRSKCSKIKYK